MEWIFVVSSVGSLGLMTAQLLDYIVESVRVRKSILQDGAFSNEGPPGDALWWAETPNWRDEAA
jgi:hypothetical protein